MINTEVFVEYDKLRLISFKQNIPEKSAIDILESKHFTALKFIYLDYFNYCFGNVFDQVELQKLISFYKDTNLQKFRFLVNSTKPQKEAILLKNDFKLMKKELVKTKLESANNFIPHYNEDVQLISVTNENVDHFIKIYLECFQAENRHKESVNKNFRSKLNIPGAEFFLVSSKKNFIGIASFYMHENSVFLSSGGILPEFQFEGFHKVILSKRIAKCLYMNPNATIYSWAYANSVSLSNMLKVGMSSETRYKTFEYTF